MRVHCLSLNSHCSSNATTAGLIGTPGIDEHLPTARQHLRLIHPTLQLLAKLPHEAPHRPNVTQRVQRLRLQATTQHSQQERNQGIWLIWQRDVKTL
jgi:hypothetical protein